MVMIPRLVIAAPASGSGKTTVACGLMTALRQRGLVVSGHKVGPDYIDPGYHELAAGRPRRNLDPFLCGEDLIVPLFLNGAAGARAAIVEGVMGMFDGVDPALGLDPGFGSTAHVARLLRAPVVLVVDAGQAGRSVAALVAGFAGFDPRTPVAGVILNRVASGRHERLLRDALSASGVRVYGAIRRTDAIKTPSRHLGLIPAGERDAAARHAVAQMGVLVAESCDLEGLLALAASAPALMAAPWDPAQAVSAAWPRVPGVAGAAGASGVAGAAGASGVEGVQVAAHVSGVAGASGIAAIAGGAAFTFGYTEQLELVRAAGMTVAEFDPLRDEDLPEGTSGVLIGGGFPETVAADLAANEPLRRHLAGIAAAGAPVVGECAGLLYLARTLDGHPMCGVIDAHATMTPKLTLGYRRARAAADSVLAREGEAVRGHEFHRTSITPSLSPAWRLTHGADDGHAARNVLASYLHVHWAGNPAFASRFAQAASTAAVTR